MCTKTLLILRSLLYPPTTPSFAGCNNKHDLQKKVWNSYPAVQAGIRKLCFRRIQILSWMEQDALILFYPSHSKIPHFVLKPSSSLTHPRYWLGKGGVGIGKARGDQSNFSEAKTVNFTVFCYSKFIFFFCLMILLKLERSCENH